MSEFLKRGAVSQAVSGGPLSPRSGRGNKTDGVFAYWFAQGKSILATFLDSFTRSDNGSVIAGGPVDWLAESGTWGIDTNQASTSTAAASYPLVTFDAGTVAATVKATLPTTRSAGAGVAFWVTDSNNWWAAVADKVDTTGAPYNCSGPGSANNSTGNCSYTYGAQGGGPGVNGGGYYGYWACNGGASFGSGCWYYDGNTWIQFGTGYIACCVYVGPFPYDAPYNYTPTNVTYAGTATSFNRSDIKIIKKTAGVVSTVSTTQVANPSSTSYLTYIQATTTPTGVAVTAVDSSAPNTVTTVNAVAGLPLPAQKFGVVYTPSTAYANPKVEAIEYTPGA